MAEALGKHYASDVFESFSAGTELKEHINPDAVRLIKKLYSIDMEKTQYSKLLSDIPAADVVILMGCNVNCPNVQAKYIEDWGLNDPTGKSDDEFIEIINQIENKVLELKEKLKN
jgi:arsenate reductase